MVIGLAVPPSRRRTAQGCSGRPAWYGPACPPRRGNRQCRRYGRSHVHRATRRALLPRYLAGWRLPVPSGQLRRWITPAPGPNATPLSGGCTAPLCRRCCTSLWHGQNFFNMECRRTDFKPPRLDLALVVHLQDGERIVNFLLSLPAIPIVPFSNFFAIKSFQFP